MNRDGVPQVSGSLIHRGEEHPQEKQTQEGGTKRHRVTQICQPTAECLEGAGRGQGDAKIKLKLNEENGDMKLGFYYTPLSSKVNVALQEAFQKETKPFLDVNKDRAVETLDLMKF